MKILYVDDDDTNIRVLERLLLLLNRTVAEFNADLTTAKTATEARDLCQNTSFDWIFVDLSLPDGDGIELARQLDQDSHKVLLSALPLAELKSQVLDFELFQHIISKPISLDKLKTVWKLT